MIDVKDCIGKKVILRGKGYDMLNFYEVDILKFSPSKKFIKIKIDREEKWERVDTLNGKFHGYQIEDILGDIDKF